ncbi:MAG: helix-turn-helix domain-containing protein [Marinomonas sp.]
MRHSGIPDIAERKDGFTFLGEPDFTPDECIRSAYHSYMGSAFISDTMPAVGGQFCLRTKGSSLLQYPDGTSAGAGAGELYFIAPTTMASEAHLRGPGQLYGLGLSELGWAEMTGLRVDEVKNTIIPAEQVFGAAATKFGDGLLEQCRAGTISPAEIVSAMRGFLAERRTPIKDERKQLILTARSWATDTMQPDVKELYDALPLSPRQIQRLVQQYFGQAPNQVALRMRAAFTASVMSHGSVTPQVDAEIGESYTDQSHLIRDVKKTTGRTPSKLGKRSQSLLSDILNPDGFLHDKAHTKKLPSRQKPGDMED